MTGLENSVRGTAFYKNEDGEYEELGMLKQISIEAKDIELGNELRYLTTEAERKFECEITDKESIRKLKQLFKTDKEEKAERRFNKNSFRNFIKDRNMYRCRSKK